MHSLPNNTTKKSILVTGANGFIGSHFIQSYQDQYHIRTASLQKTPIDELNLAGVDAVLHLAALAQQSKKISWESYHSVNTVLTEKLAEKAKASGVSQFVFFSSIKVYGNDGDLDNHQFTLNEGSEAKPTDFYGLSKLMAEKALLEMQSDRFKVAIIRPAMVYGAGIKGNMFSLMKLVKKVPILPFDYAINRRALVGINNLLHLTDLIIQKQAQGIFIGKDEGHLSIKEIAQILSEGLGKKRVQVKLPSFIFNLLRKVRKGFMTRLYGTLALEQKSKYLDIGYQPIQKTTDGLKEMCTWYRTKK